MERISEAPFMANTWEKKMQESVCRGSAWDAFGDPPAPPLGFWARARKALAYHLFHRWKALRFGFHRVCSCREDW